MLMAFNLGGALSGGLGGAGTGATLGSFGGPVGTGVGAGLGALIGLLGGGFSGNEGGFEQAQNLTPQQQSILEYLLTSGQQGMENPYEGFEPIKQNALSTFFQDIVPQLQNQFSASGSNAISSPVLQSNLSSAGAGLAQRLALLQSQYGQQNKQNALQQLQLGLKPGFENVYRQSQPGFGGSLLSSSLQAAPQLFQLYQANKALTGNKGQTGLA